MSATIERSQLRAFVLSEGDPQGDGSAVWTPSGNYEQIMNTDDDCLIFMPDGTLLYESGYYSKSVLPATLRQDLEEEFSRRYPSIHRLLPRFSITTAYGTRYFAKTGEEITYAEYQQHRFRDSRDNYEERYGTHIQRVAVSPIQTARDTVYTGCCPEEAMELCQFFGGRVAVAPGLEKSAKLFRRNGSGRDSEENDELLREAGYYCRLIPDHGDYFSGNACYEIVYNPKKVAAAAKAIETRRRRQKDSGNSRTASYLRIDEFYELLRSMTDTLDTWLKSAKVDEHRRQYSSYSRRHGRDWVVSTLSTLLHDFNLLFGRNAHRKLESFQKFLRLWKKHGESTRKAFGSADLWDWLDKELKARKPAKKAIVTESVSGRVQDLP